MKLDQLMRILLRSRGGRSFPTGRRGRKSPVGTLVVLLLAAALAYWQYSGHQRSEPARRPPAPVETPVETTVERPAESSAQIAQLFRDRKSGVLVTASGEVVRLLSDDNETRDGSSRHQRFVVRLPDGQTLLLVHNIDLAPRVPVRVAESVRFRGEYEWSREGGLVHWTHHDPKGIHPGGWIEHAGRRYE